MRKIFFALVLGGVLAGVVLVGVLFSFEAQAIDCSSPVSGQVCDMNAPAPCCNDPLYICKKISSSGTGICTCRWGFFEADWPSWAGLGDGDICEFIEGIPASDKIGGVAKMINVVVVMITAIVVMVALISIVIGGYIYMTAGGSADRVRLAKSWIVSAIIGIILALLAYTILTLINSSMYI